jgi:hypothetical protein
MPDHSHPEPASGTEAAREIVACAERTLAAPSARIELHQEFTYQRPEWPRPRGLSGMVLRLAGKLGKLLARAWWRRATRHLEPARRPEFGHLVGEGIAEPARGRYMIDYGSYAQIHTEGKTFGGGSGRSFQKLDLFPGRGAMADALWLVSLLRGATDASLDGTETLHGTVCRRLAAHADMERASAASGEGLPAPQVDRFEELRAMPVTVWIDGQHVRRVRFQQAVLPKLRRTLDLWDFGVPVNNLDWSHLPTFRSPGHGQKRKPWYQHGLRRYGRAR